MSDTSPVLSLPLLMPSQAQKHVTHNEALLQIESLVQLAVRNRDLPTPPAVPVAGQRHIVGENATGAWAGHEQAVATYDGAAWRFAMPEHGWRAEVLADGTSVVFDGTAWQNRSLDLGNVATLGVATTADSTNRLAVSSPAVLLNHAGGGHQLKINKATAPDTASLLYQTDFSGRAEIGLSGDDDLSIKVSPDGGAWTTALAFDATSGRVSGEAVQAGPSDTSPGRLMRADYGYSPGNLVGTVAQSGGMPSGAAFQSGTNANGGFTRFADGTQMCTRRINLGSRVAYGSGTRGDPYRTGVVNWTYPAAFSSVGAVTATGEIDILSAAERAHSVSVRGVGLSEVTFVQAAMMSSATTAVDVVVHLLAIGRWY
ncbi:DUF2793 domain-containing protein [Oceaniglobus trochenteri]|uniref:DUF2793 domain-containing protein n=1 Tax=Oceaniglobus trochenteri TaxID=2763260 RepID=UPI001CFFA865|nr:DUF2793 domain-containing protein [Oceaniglobus trochenteri]